MKKLIGAIVIGTALGAWYELNRAFNGMNAKRGHN